LAFSDAFVLEYSKELNLKEKEGGRKSRKFVVSKNYF
jgi:hypothetical protein